MNAAGVLGLNPTPLAKAAAFGDAAAVRAALQQGEDPLFANNHRLTPLHLACLLGQPAAAHELVQLRNPAVLNAKADGGATPLILASQSGKVQLVDMLLQAGASPMVADGNECTALHMACCVGAEAVVAKLLACSMGGDFVNAVDNTGSSALHLASEYGASGCVKLLLQAGARPDLAGTRGAHTALHMAANRGRADCVRALLAAGADACAASDIGNTPAHLAALNGHQACVELVLSAAGAGARDARTNLGATPLHMACQGGHTAVAAALIAAGADVNALTVAAQLPWHLASLGGHAACADMLAAAGGGGSGAARGGVMVLDRGAKVVKGADGGVGLAVAAPRERGSDCGGMTA